MILLNNFLNANEVFPILDLIRREIRKNNFDQGRPALGDDDLSGTDVVTSLEVLRGSNAYDPEMIDTVIVTYADESTETLTMHRGISPEVPATIPDYDYINKALLTGFTVESNSEYTFQTTTCTLIRENGYGKVVKVEFSYGE